MFYQNAKFLKYAKFGGIEYWRLYKSLQIAFIYWCISSYEIFEGASLESKKYQAALGT